MPTFEYLCPSCGRRFDDLASSPPPKTTRCACGKKARVQFSPTNATIVPAWMKAPGSKGSSADATDRNAAYYQSERHRKDMAQAERIAAREERLAGNLQQLEKRLESAAPR